MRILPIIPSLALLLACAEGAEELTSKTFEQFVDSGKNGMVKFYQSWCGHCMRMKPDWDRLADEESNDSVLIADVNCGEQKELCDEQSVTGYPTIYYYVDGEEQIYNGPRSFEDLSEFVAENLAKSCTFDETADCSERALKYVEKWKAKGSDDRKKEVARLESMVEKSMKSDLKKWVRERIRILSSSSTDNEL